MSNNNTVWTPNFSSSGMQYNLMKGSNAVGACSSSSASSPAGSSTQFSSNVCINNALSQDLLLKIFSYLDIRSLCRCSQVCKLWYQMAFDGSNWRHIDLFMFQTDIKPHVVKKIAQNCRGFLRRLRLRGCQDITDDTVRCFAEQCPLVEELVLSECRHLTDASLTHLGHHCHQLKVLLVDCCAQVTDVGLCSLVAYPSRHPSTGALQASHLTVLDLSWCQLVTDVGLTAVVSACPQLVSLRCLGCRLLTSAGIAAVAEHCPHLGLINVNFCREAMTDQALKHLAKGCPRLRHLSMSRCDLVTDVGLKAVSAGCPELHTLEVSHCRQLSDTGFLALASNCHMLKKLDLEECSLITDGTIRALAAHCPLVDSLILSHCEQITDDSIQRLAASEAGRHNLRHLALDNCTLITDVALEALGDHCERLSKLEVFDCQSITRMGLRRLNERLDQLKMQAYFAPPVSQDSDEEEDMPRRRYCRCCVVL